jgi:hypothetical protein
MRGQGGVEHSIAMCGSGMAGPGAETYGDAMALIGYAKHG